MKDFKNKVAVVTGEASGIGRAIAERCVHEGAHVVLADIELPALQEAERALTAQGGQVLAVQTDVSDCPAWVKTQILNSERNRSPVLQNPPLDRAPSTAELAMQGLNLERVRKYVRP